MHRFVGILGMLTMLSLAYIFSTDRRAIRYKTVAWGLGLQIAFAFIVMRWETGRYIFQRLGAAVNWFLDFAYYGSSFIFGDLGLKNSPKGFYFAFQTLPTIIFIAAIFALLYYYGIMQIVVKAAAHVMTKAHGRERRRIAQRGRQHLHGPDRSAAHDPPVPARNDEIGDHDRHDQRHGARLRRNDGRVHRLRRESRAPARCGHHDGAGHDPDREDAGAGNRKAAHGGPRGNGGNGKGHQRARRAFARARSTGCISRSTSPQCSFRSSR